jgi:hypothetical protein
MTKSTSTPEEKRLVREFDDDRKHIADMIEGVATGDVSRFSSAFYETMGHDDGGTAIWRAAFRGIAELTSVPTSPIQAYFAQEIVGVEDMGEGYLEAALGRDLLIAAYRKLLTPYFGRIFGPKTLKLYCVTTAANYRAACYDLHWYDEIDEVHADWEGWYDEPGGAVLVETLAPAEAIISRYVVRHIAYPRVNTGEWVEKKNEVKFVVDPRRLTDVTVVKHLSREDFLTSPPGRRTWRSMK